ncbi:UNVERIFIED_CONTAM: hypothetical protein PYX00_009375 [Menopon gallinae]
MVSRYDRTKKKINHIAVNACLAPICSMHGAAVTTVEGIGSTKTKLHPVQERLAKAHGSQCGFCTPGIVMSMYALLRHNSLPSMHDMEVAFQGNLCRCTGYRPIIEGLRTFTKEYAESEKLKKAHVNGYEVNGVNGHDGQNGINGHGVNGYGQVNGINGNVDEKKMNGVNGCHKEIEQAKKALINGHNGIGECDVQVDDDIMDYRGKAEGNGCAMGKNCCKNGKKCLFERAEDEILYNVNDFAPYDPSQEAIFPPELMLDPTLDEQYLIIKGERATWFRPTLLQDLLALKSKFPHAKIVAGNSEVGVEQKFKSMLYPVLISPNQIKELTSVEYLENGIKFGAAVSLTEIFNILKQESLTRPEYQTRIFRASLSMLNLFAGKQIRNVACLGGNIMTGSPIADMNPVLMAAGAQLYLKSVNSSRVITMDHTFFTGYRKNCVLPDELLTAVLIPFTKRDEYFNAYKQAKRREDDITIVNCACRVDFVPDTNVVKDFDIALGGMAPFTSLSLKAKKVAIGRAWDKQLLEDVYAALIEEFPLPPSAPGGMVQYRRSLSLSHFFRFYLYVLEALSGKIGSVARLSPRLLSAINPMQSLELKCSQYFQVVPKDQPKFDAVGRPLVHVNAFKQATGEALYCDDMPRAEGELYVTFVLSTRPHAKILNIDATQALAVPGVHHFFCHKDMDKRVNEMGPIFHDEEVFFSEKVTSQGQVIGAIVAENQIISQRAAKLVKVEYEDLSPVIITIEQAIEHKSFIGDVRRITRGNAEEAMKTADYVREGQVHMGGQEHFYLETHCCLAIPREEDEMEIICSTQNAAEIQKLAAMVLEIPYNRVSVKVKRIGGGFGGKESRGNLVAVPLAFIAHKIKRPVRCMLDRDEDMMMTAGRHPFMAKYKVGFNKDGKIVAVSMDIYCNAGYSMDLSCGVLDRSLFHGENAYLFPHFDVRGYICLTNLPSNTAFRGFGGPQGMFFAENIIELVADEIKMPLEEVRGKNLYVEGDITHYNQTLTYCTLQRCWEECLRRADYKKRREEIIEFNKRNRYRKRGMSIVPTKFGIAFTELCLNQAGALVHVYRDGSVLLSHAGIEMGQGLNTKMIQVASRALGIDASMIYIAEMATDKVPNSSATAASSGSDLNGGAVMDACLQIIKRLEPIKAENPKGTWKDWVMKAYRERICLSAAGFFRTPDIGWNAKENKGMAFNYFTYGCAATVVEIDCLSGDHQLLRTDIVMDLGESLNPAIDIGQVEGAFVQGLGLFTLEELVYSPTGTMFTRGPGMYKIPGFTDIPAEFNVSLLRGAPNPRAVYSSKAVGEPPLFLAVSAFFAIKDAIRAAREEVGIKGHFRLDSPATSARIRMSCTDNITEKFPDPKVGSYVPWNIVP